MTQEGLDNVTERMRFRSQLLLRLRLAQRRSTLVLRRSRSALHQLRLALAPAVREERGGLAGVWRLKTFVSEDVQSGERRTVFGRHPNGCLVLTPSGRLFAILTARKRAAIAPLIAYSGTYRVEGTTLTTTVDIAWDEGWIGTNVVRHYRIEGNTLYIETPAGPNVDHGGRTMRFLLSWKRVSRLAL